MVRATSGAPRAAPSPRTRAQLAKYKRVTGRLKEVLEDTKRQVGDREQQLRALEARHFAAAPAGLWRLIEQEEAAGVPGCTVCEVQCRVAPDGVSWCFVTGRDQSGVKWRGWVPESDLIQHAPEVSLPPSLSSARDSVDQVPPLPLSCCGCVCVCVCLSV